MATAGQWRSASRNPASPLLNSASGEESIQKAVCAFNLSVLDNVLATQTNELEAKPDYRPSWCPRKLNGLLRWPHQQECSMLMNVVSFPIVRLTYDEGPGQTDDEAFAAFETLLDRGAPFVIIGQGDAHTVQHKHDQEERKRLALWSKNHKPRLRALVKAMIFVEPSKAKRLGMKAFQIVSEKFWGYPMLVAASDAEALATAHALLKSSSNRAQRAESGASNDDAH
ncbi:hypothetical protein IVB46_42465 [Bradyrhizobium sp. 61]|uniref:hypothetical protein n=1 Tax=unclassified Bradyrhizobium TaxID=2631580 RepID=UPI001FF970FC|nr:MULTISPECIES: hypothetical protein [unclassified Bradyrhizobium]MCK1281897.1 hypothetical protein [Bradyrhizobium sp. 61]MCK1459793.1 hypothetical protein [Bradyrhizobium sp. 2]